MLLLQPRRSNWRRIRLPRGERVARRRAQQPLASRHRLVRTESSLGLELFALLAARLQTLGDLEVVAAACFGRSLVKRSRHAGRGRCTGLPHGPASWLVWRGVPQAGGLPAAAWSAAVAAAAAEQGARRAHHEEARAPGQARPAGQGAWWPRAVRAPVLAWAQPLAICGANGVPPCAVRRSSRSRLRSAPCWSSKCVISIRRATSSCRRHTPMVCVCACLP